MAIRALTYSIFIKRAEKRLLELHAALRDAPFLKEQGIDPETCMCAQQPRQGDLGLDAFAVVGWTRFSENSALSP